MPFKAGQVIGGYRLEAFLGRGAMGEVYRARHVESQARVAIKTFDLTDDDPQLRQRFEREGQAMARVKPHPNVLQAHSLIEVGGHLFLVLELAPGGDLMGRLKTAPPGHEELREWMRGLTAGAAHLHAAGVVHRDIKPQNVLFDAAGTPKLGDFGLARLADAQSLTLSGHILGTPAYMPPEQIRDAKDVGPPADIYALGALLFRCLTLAPVFRGGSFMATVSMILNEDPPDPRELAPETPADLARLCLRMLAKAPAERPTAEQVLEALTPGPPAAPHRKLWLGGLVLLLAVCGLGLGAALLRGPRPLPPPPATVRPAQTSPTPAPTPHESPRASPFPKHAPVARELSWSYRVRCLDDTWALVTSRHSVYRVPLTGGEPRLLKGWPLSRKDDWIHDLAVDRSGARFAVSSHEGHAWIWRDGIDGEPSELPRELVENARLAFSPDGSRLATRDATSILVFDGGGQRLLWKQPYEPTWRMWFAFLDAETLVTASTVELAKQTTVLTRWDLASGQRQGERTLKGIVSCLRADPRHRRVAVGSGLGAIAVLEDDQLVRLRAPHADAKPSLGGWVTKGGTAHAPAVRELVFAGDQLLSLACSALYPTDTSNTVLTPPEWAAWDLRTGRRLDAGTFARDKERHDLDWIPGTKFVIETSGDKVYWEELSYPEAQELSDR